MDSNSIIIRHLCFTGPEKVPALIEFGQGLNVLYGASDTGKSFVVEAIDFMLGGNTPLRDIPERIGYDKIFLGLQTLEGEAFTLARSTQGGNFQLLTGLHQVVPLGQEARILSHKHNANKNDSVSTFLLEKIGLLGKVLRKNLKGTTRSLSFRDLSHTCLIDETEVQKKGSPIETSGQPALKPVEYSIFKFLLTGIDDSSVVVAVEDAELSRIQEAQVEFIDELISKFSEKLHLNNIDEEELREQLTKLDLSIKEGNRDLNAVETEYQELFGKRDPLKEKVEQGIVRRLEIDEITARFTLLNDHYNTDLERLESIQEAGTLLSAINLRSCPLCGALPDHQHAENAEVGNIELIVSAATAEAEKIKLLQGELLTTLQQLGTEAASFDQILPRLNTDLRAVDTALLHLRTTLNLGRGNYGELIEKRSEVREMLSWVDQINDLNERKADIRSQVDSTPSGESTALSNVTDLSTSVLDDFAQFVESILTAWNFPDSNRVQFDQSSRDLIIAGKQRGSRGKGLRAITHAAFAIGILQFCKSKSHAHPGFLIIDSPLLAYREPESTEDDLSQTNVQDKFYEYLSLWQDRQIIVIENVTPPEPVTRIRNSQFFSKNDNYGRYGFFPR